MKIREYSRKILFHHLDDYFQSEEIDNDIEKYIRNVEVDSVMREALKKDIHKMICVIHKRFL